MKTEPDRRAAPVRKPARPVMKEVADRAGVALSSVSRVLSDHPDVSTVMRNRVLDAVASLGYEPDMLAQSLRTGETMTVGFLVGDISNHLLGQIALGAEVRLHAAGYSTLLTNSVNDPGLDAAHLKLLQQRRVDGMLLSLSNEDEPATRTALQRMSIPGVLVDRRIAGADLAAVLTDHAGGIEAAATHLITLGHRSIGLVNGSTDVRPSRERSRALRRVCRQAGVATTVRSSMFTAEHGYRATLQIVQGSDRPTALISGGNQILVGVLRALRETGLTIGSDISLVTCDDVPLLEFLDPVISTITRDPALIGRTAAELLLEQMRGDAPRDVLLPTEFRPTRSCAPPSGHSRRG